MSDHTLPPGSPASDIGHVKRLWIFIEAGPEGNWAQDLRFGIAGHTSADEDESGGTPISSVADAERLIAEFRDADVPEVTHLAERTPLDFAIQKKCFVVLKLFGDFWEFSRREGPVKTKLPQGRRYYNLRPHERDGRVVSVSFCAEAPHPQGSGNGNIVKHAINLYVDFLQTRGTERLRLPVLIDPDIENKGSGGGLAGDEEIEEKPAL